MSLFYRVACQGNIVGKGKVRYCDRTDTSALPWVDSESEFFLATVYRFPQGIVEGNHEQMGLSCHLGEHLLG